MSKRGRKILISLLKLIQIKEIMWQQNAYGYELALTLLSYPGERWKVMGEYLKLWKRQRTGDLSSQYGSKDDNRFLSKIPFPLIQEGKIKIKNVRDY